MSDDGWINIKYDLPVHNQLVDIFGRRHGRWARMTNLRYEDGTGNLKSAFVSDTFAYTIPIHDVTHWMIIPESPQ